MAERVLGLRHVYLPRAGYAFTAGFPLVVAARFVQRALYRGCPVVLVSSQQSGGLGNRIAILWPQSSSVSSGPSGKPARSSLGLVGYVPQEALSGMRRETDFQASSAR